MIYFFLSSSRTIVFHCFSEGEWGEERERQRERDQCKQEIGGCLLISTPNGD